MQETINIVLLAVLQGVAEFLPISSSGHLVVGSHLLGGNLEDSSSQLNIVLHVGTLLSIVLFYYKRIWKLLTSDRRVILLLIVGSIPVGTIGLGIKLFFDDYLESLRLTGFMFPLTGLLLLLLYWKKDDGKTEQVDIPLSHALLIGIAQAVAILPGISRSGATIASAILLGVKREAAATFSFLLAIPAIGGAGLYETYKLLKQEQTGPAIWQLGLGVAVSFAVGLASLYFLVRLVEGGKLHWFAAWLIPLGLVVIGWSYFGG